MANNKSILSYCRITFNSGREVETPETGMIVIVGPNNVGKTTSIYELQNRIHGGVLQHNSPNVVFASAELRKGSDEEFLEWLDSQEDHRYQAPINQPDQRRYRNWGQSVEIPPQHMMSAFQEMGPNNRLAPLLTSSGTGAPFEGQTPNLYNENGADPMGNNRQFHELLLSKELQERISSISQAVFGTPIGFNVAGSQAGLHFGKIPDIQFPATEEQIEALRKVPLLKNQGQGVTTFMSQAMSIELGSEPMVFLDEPEAHLHPPQARKAGAFVARRAERSQVFIATHDLDYLLGLLGTDVPALIIRLDRSGNEQSVSVIEQHTIKELWNNVTIRYSGLLAGLMHRGVVICEAEADCRFFEVTLDHHSNNETPHDLRFVHAGGKGGLANLSQAALDLAIPSVVVADFDVLRSWNDLSRLITTRRAAPDEFHADWQVLDNHLRQKLDERTRSGVAAELSEVLEDDSTQTYSAEDRKRIESVAKLKHGWEHAKELGVRLLNGDVLTKTKGLLERLDEIGIHLIRTGELESMLPETTGGLHGPAWTAKVLDDGTYKDLGDEERDFVLRIPGICA